MKRCENSLLYGICLFQKKGEKFDVIQISTCLFFRYRSTRKPTAFAAFLPLTFLFGYQADLAYGTKLNRVKVEAENILLYENDLIEMPGGLPTLESIDAARKQPTNE